MHPLYFFLLSVHKYLKVQFKAVEEGRTEMAVYNWRIQSSAPIVPRHHYINGSKFEDYCLSSSVPDDLVDFC